MRPLRCLICGETYIGRNQPDRCPYCGVDGRFITDAAEYVEYDGMTMCEESENFVRQAIKIEKSNIAFYQCSADNAKSPVIRALFKRIGKHEGEHMELLCDHLGIEEPEIEPEGCSTEDSINMKKGHAREERAVCMYTRFASEAPEQRLKQIFSAIAGIEQEHGKLFTEFG